MEIITNNVPRDIIFGYELTADEKQEFDYLDFTKDDDSAKEFVKYKGETYDLGEFMPFADTIIPQMARDAQFNGWDGYQSDTFFSGILVRFDPEESATVIMGRYYT